MLSQRKKKEAAPIAQHAAEPVLPSQVEQAGRAETALAVARATLEAARAELASAHGSYEAAADGAMIDKAVAARTRIVEAEVAVDLAERAVERRQAELTAVLGGFRDAAALAERDRLREAAVTAQATYETAFVEHMPSIIAQARHLVRLEALAMIAHEGAIAVGVDLPRPNAFRDDPGSPRIEISKRTLDLWINEWGHAPFGDEAQEKIKRQIDGTGVLYGSTHTHITSKKRRYEEIEYYDAVPVSRVEPLAKHLVLPELTANDHVGWAAPDNRNELSAREVLKRLDALEIPPSEKARVVRRERRPVEPARDVTRKVLPQLVKTLRSI